VGTGHALGARGSTSLVGMPRLLAMVAEIHAAARALTVKLWTAGTAACYHGVADTTMQHTVISMSQHHRYFSGDITIRKFLYSINFDSIFSSKHF